MSGYEDMIAGAEVSVFRLVFETQTSGAREHCHPFIPGLIIPEPRRLACPVETIRSILIPGRARSSVMTSSDRSNPANSAKRFVASAMVFADLVFPNGCMVQDHEIHRITALAAHAHIGNDERRPHPQALSDALGSLWRQFDAVERRRRRLQERL